jgi:Ca2+-binding RTX toxin-like protein
VTTYIGNEFNNTFHGGGDDDYAEGWDGNDVLSGGGGVDSLHGGNQDDVLSGNNGDDFLTGGSGNDTVDGGAGNDIVVGDDGTNTLLGGDGNDKIFSGSSLGSGLHDTINGGAGNDIITDQYDAVGTMTDGGAGIDRLYLYRQNTLTTGMNITFKPGSSNVVTLPDNTTFKNIELLNVIGGSGNDTIHFINPIYDATVGGNSFSGSEGIDTLHVVMTADTKGISAGVSQGTYFANQMIGGVYQQIVYASGSDTENFQVEGGTGNDYIGGADFDDILTGNDGKDTLIGFLGGNVLTGGAGNDIISNSGHLSRLLGGNGDDALTDSGMDSKIDGGAGLDSLVIDRSMATEKTVLTFTPGGTYHLQDGTDFTNIEQLDIRTGSGNDSVSFINPIVSGDFLNHWSAGDGNDTLTVDVSTETRVVSGGVSDGAFYLSRVSGSDIKTIIYAYGVENYKLMLGSGSDIVSAGDGKDQLTGGRGADILSGLGDDDVLNGGIGDDTLNGGDGKDTLIGGDGNDILWGNAGGDTIDSGIGVDVLNYAGVTDSNDAGYDRLISVDFAKDTFDLLFAVEGIDTATTAASVKKFANVLDAAHLGIHHAVLVTLTSTSELFLVVDANGTAGYQAGEELVFKLDTPTHLDQLSTASFT